MSDRSSSSSAPSPEPPLRSEAALRSCVACRAIYRSGFECCPVDGGAIVSSETDPLVGTTLGPYTLTGFIGEGAMGRVYRAHHTRLERRALAIKVLLGDVATSRAGRLRFSREAEAASRLDHPNVVSVHDVGSTSAGLIYLVMDLVIGRPLGDEIARGRLELGRAVAITRQLCLGLAHAHDQGLVHRDLKPSNIVLTPTGSTEVARIVDFGLAISTAPDDADARLTTEGIAVGTPTYMAPEQIIDGGFIDHRADLYALGVTLYEMLSGVAPFEGSRLEVLQQTMNGTAPPLATRCPEAQVPTALEAIVRRLMARRPRDRYGSAREVLADLDALDLGLAAAALATERRPATTRQAPRLIALAIAAVAAAVAIPLFNRDRAEDAAAAPSSATPPSAADVPVPGDTTEVAATAAVEPAQPTRPTERVEKRRKRTPRDGQPRATRASAPSAATVGAAASVPAAPAVRSNPTAPVARPSPPVALVPTTARVAITGLRVDGALADSVVRRALGPLLPELRRCYLDAAARAKRGSTETLAIRFVVDDRRRASAIETTGGKLPGLAGCAASALRGLRTELSPDVGDAAVALGVSFTPGAR